jgi:hypothetical protein
MIWFFERHQSRLHYEIRRQCDGHGYELAITHPDGRQVIEQYGNPTDLIERAMILQNTLIADGWQPPPARPRTTYRPAEC